MYVMARLEAPGENEARMSSGPVNTLSVVRKKRAVKKKKAVRAPAQAPSVQILIVAKKYLATLTKRLDDCLLKSSSDSSRSRNDRDSG